MSDTSVDEKVKKIVCDQMGTTPDKISLETSFINDLAQFFMQSLELFKVLRWKRALLEQKKRLFLS